MIKVTFKHDTNRNTISFKVTGHSGASAIGTDLICAGASTLAYTLAQNVLDGFNDDKFLIKPIINIKSGDMRVDCKVKDEFYDEFLYMYFVIQKGFVILSKNYPKNITVKILD